MRFLLACRRNFLFEITFGINEADADKWQTDVTGFFAVITGENP